MVRRSKYVGCIDIHNGQVKQIVGGTLSEKQTADLKTNYVSQHDTAYYADLYRTNGIQNCHVIKLGPNCDEAAELALKTWPKGLQVGGGINDGNAKQWIEKGASKVIVTSYLFPSGSLDTERLKKLVDAVGKENLVIDLSCRRVQGKGWVVAMDKWQRLTEYVLSKESITELSHHCAEFLVHAADVEGLCQGIDEELVAKLAEWSPIPVVYAGGGKSLEDLALVDKLSGGKVDLTFGSALDIFGGFGVKFSDAVEWNNKE